MKVTKFIHSCLLIEIDSKKILIDPGVYTANSNSLDLNLINMLDYLLITHEHADHMHIPLVKEIVRMFPNIKIITNNSVKKILGEERINSFITGDDLIKIEDTRHEKVFGINPPENLLFNIGNFLTHPGDSHSFENTNKVLALPVQAPWCSLTEAVNLAEKLKPEIILPIHDWHWSYDARSSFYQRLEDYFKNLGIKFIPLIRGKEYEM
ncbi:MAG: MBL fold metallo-hydrolase [Patescibacteria group bacterium]